MPTRVAWGAPERGRAADIGCLLEAEELRQRLAGSAQRRAEGFSAGKMAVRLADVYASLL